MSRVERLKDVIRRLHGCEAEHAGTVVVSEEFGPEISWEGQVEVFDLVGHARAGQCYAWRYKRDHGMDQYVTVLRLPPVDTPAKAVQAAIVAEYKRTH